MNKVLVVDDEKLVRQGIITTFPWEKHGFVVAGDAASGEKALELLESDMFDLLVTDLAMNGMSGLELIRRVRRTCAHMPVVILTCHDDFKSIQEAMRLGVLDYIVKTEIEDDAVEETLRRIAAKLSEATDGRLRTDVAAEKAESGAGGDGLLLCGPSRASTPQELLGGVDWGGYAGRLAEIGGATWLLRMTGPEADRLLAAIRPQLDGGSWSCIRLSGLDTEDESAVLSAVKQYRRRVLFYRLADAPRAIALRELREAGEAARQAAAEHQPPDWNGAAWLYEEERFAGMLKDTELAARDSAELRTLFYPVVLEWERLLGAVGLKDLMERADELLYWPDWKSWIRSLRDTILAAVSRNGSRQIVDCVLNAIELLDNGSGPMPGESEIAKAVNMSRGYFSKCFKKVTGRAYGDYVRELRLERAKRLLLRTDDSITLVAEYCGFSDYRHFSRVFRDFTGMLPNEYRKTGGTM